MKWNFPYFDPFIAGIQLEMEKICGHTTEITN